MDRTQAMRRVLLLTLGLNLTATAAKLVAGMLSNSLSLIAGGFDSLFDSAANIVALVGVGLAARPPDSTHPYGHRKFETLATVVITALVALAGVELLRGALSRATSDVRPTIAWWTVGASIIGISLSGVASHYEARQGRRLRSELLLADAQHSRTDMAVSVAVLGGQLGMAAGLPWLDPLLAIGIAMVIGRMAVSLIGASSQVLADAAAVSESEVRRLAFAIPGVEDVHAIRSRGLADSVWLDLHVKVNPYLGIERAHAIGHAVKDRLQAGIEGLRDVVVHVEPHALPADTSDVVSRVRRIVSEFPVNAHEVEAYHGAQGVHVSLHVEMDGQMTLGNAHALASDIESAVLDRLPKVQAVTTHLEPERGAPIMVGPAVGAARRESVMQALRAAAASVEGLSACHDVDVRLLSEGLVVTLHCVSDPDLPLSEAHRLSAMLERELTARVPDIGRVVVHIEPEA